MDDHYRTRRGILVAIGTIATTSLAGCAGDDDADPTGDAPDGADDSAVDDDGNDHGESNGSADSTPFGEVVTYANAYEFVVVTPEDDAEMIGRFDGEHMYWRMERDSELVEMYYIANDIYFVENEQSCMVMSSDQDMPGPDPEPIDTDTTDPEVLGGVGDSMTYIGTDNIEGDPVYAYEHEDVDGVMYVHRDSGLPRRFDSPDATVDWFYDDIGPVNPPDLACEELPDF